MNRKLESLQRRALTTMLGRAAAPGARVNGRALEVVFGELSMKDRRWLDRLRYAYSLPAAWAREWRKGVMQRLWDYALRNKSFARETVTGAIQRAVEDLKLEIETQATLAEQEIDPDSDVESGAESDGRTGGSSDDESRESSVRSETSHRSCLGSRGAG